MKEWAIKMVLSHLGEYNSVYIVALSIGPKVGVQPEFLRRWVQAEVARGTPEGEAMEAKTAGFSRPG